MKSYKCVECSLTNWTTADVCKRCQSPNPYSNQFVQANSFSPNQTQVLARPMPSGRAMPDYFVPPPPNVFGASVGTMAASPVECSSVSPPMPAKRPPIRHAFQSDFSPEDFENLKKAEKEIRHAWIAGAIVCGISLAVAALFTAVSSSKDMLPASPLEIFISVIIIGGLTIGVYFKSRACVILLCGLFILDKIVTWALTGKMGGVFLSVVIMYYFALGIQGTFTYHKLKKKNPNLS